MTTKIRTFAKNGIAHQFARELRKLRTAATLDHVKPKSKGGRRVVIACRPCNSTKADLDVEVFLAWLRSEVGRAWIALGPNRQPTKILNEASIRNLLFVKCFRCGAMRKRESFDPCGNCGDVDDPF